MILRGMEGYNSDIMDLACYINLKTLNICNIYHRKHVLKPKTTVVFDIIFYGLPSRALTNGRQPELADRVTSSVSHTSKPRDN